jgi:hypothetical protein
MIHIRQAVANADHKGGKGTGKGEEQKGVIRYASVATIGYKDHSCMGVT